MNCWLALGSTAEQGTELRVESLLQSTGGSVTALDLNEKPLGAALAAGAGDAAADCGWPLLVSVMAASLGTRPSDFATSPPLTMLTVPGVMPPGPAEIQSWMASRWLRTILK